MGVKKRLFVFLCIIMCCGNTIFVFGAPKDRSIETAIKIGYWKGSNAVKVAEDDSFYGATVDYFKELSKYTGDQYIFIPCEWENIESMLLNGDIDIFGPTVKGRYDQDDYIYTSSPIGYEWIYLAALSTDPITMDDYDAISERVIGVQNGTKQWPFLEDYLKRNGIRQNPAVTDASSDILVDNNTIVLTSSLRIKEGYKVIANLGMDQLYCMTTSENEIYMAEINDAIAEVKKEDPFLYDNLYTKYFSNIPVANPTLRSEDYTILDRQDSYTVGFDPNHSPFSYYNEKGDLTGIGISVMNELAKDGKFNVEYIPLIEGEYNQLDIDINMSLLEKTSFKEFLMHSDPYLYFDLMLIGPEQFDGYNHKKIASLEYENITTQEMEEFFPGAIWVPCKNIEEIKQKLSSGEVDYAFSTSITAKDILENIHREDYVITPMGYVLNIPVAFSNDMPAEFVEVFNKLIARFDDETFESIMVHEAFQVGQAKTLMDYVEIYRDEIILVLLCILSGTGGFLFIMDGNRRKILEDALNVDMVTGLSTEHKFIEDTRFIIDKDKLQKYSLLVVDIDNFKYINETFGYKVGTEVLQSFAKYLQKFFKNYKLMARIGADNFAILIDTLGVEEQIIDVIEQECGIWGNLRKLLGEDFTFNVSTGMYTIKDSDLDINYMLDCANIARNTGKTMYGRTFAKYSEAMEADRETSNFVTTQMERAVAENEFIMVYQPKIDLSTTKITGAEALVRWKQNNQFISPGDFIPLFEKNGFILKLDYYVVNAVCEAIEAWKKEGIDVPVISINLSGHTVLDRKLINNLSNILKHHNIEPKEIDLEITESAMVDNFDKVLLKIKQLKGLGFTISMDDFGTGVSTLNRLKDIPIDILKLDQGFIRHILEDEKGAIIVKNVIKMSEELGLETVGEGIETKEHLDLLIELGCDVGQGYYFARPLPKEQFEDLIR